jgi:hypothetical protein
MMNLLLGHALIILTEEVLNLHILFMRPLLQLFMGSESKSANKTGGKAVSRTLRPFFSSFPLAGKEGPWPGSDGTSVLLARIHI